MLLLPFELNVLVIWNTTVKYAVHCLQILSSTQNKSITHIWGAQHSLQENEEDMDMKLSSRVGVTFQGSFIFWFHAFYTEQILKN
jgi:hypothetical protein